VQFMMRSSVGAASLAFLCALLVLMTPVWSRADRLTILVIFPVRSSGIDLPELKNAELRQYLATRLTIEGAYGVMPESQVKRDLGSAKLESYKDCYDDACRIDLTKTVMADKFLSVDVTVESTGCRITAVLYDIAQEVTETAADLKTGCTFDDLKNSMVGVARLLSSRPSELIVTAQPVPAVGAEIRTGVHSASNETVVNQELDRTGILFVDTVPPRAELVINGTACGNAPYQGTLAPGLYRIVASSKPYYHDSVKEVVLSAEGVHVKLPLAPAFGSLRIESFPEGADVYLGKIPVGKTPYSISRLASGEYEVTVSKDLYKSDRFAVTVNDGIDVVRKVVLVEDFGSIKVDSSPSGAKVFLDGVDTGKTTPIEFVRLATGLHSLSLELDGYGQVGRSVNVVARSTSAVSETLTPKLGQLVVMSEGPDGIPLECELSLDGLVVGSTPWKGEVTARSHDLYLSCVGFSAADQVDVVHNQQKVHKVVMKASMIKDSLYWFQKQYMFGEGDSMPGGVWVNVGGDQSDQTEKPFLVGKSFSVVTRKGVLSSRVVSTEVTEGAGDTFFRAELQWPSDYPESFGLAVYEKSVSLSAKLTAAKEVTDKSLFYKSCRNIRRYLKHWSTLSMSTSADKAVFDRHAVELIHGMTCSKEHLTLVKGGFAGNVLLLAFVHISNDEPNDMGPFGLLLTLDRSGDVLWSQKIGALGKAYTVDLERDNVDELVLFTSGYENQDVWFLSWKDGLPSLKCLWSDGF